MNEATKFLKDNNVFYVATDDGGQPRVRPFGAVVESGGRVYFCTGNHKNFYKQCMQNPKAEICACAPDGQWLRITGSIVFEKNAEVKKQFFADYPGVAGIYGSVDNPIFEVFTLKDAAATLYSFSEAPRAISL